ncbi:MAG: hypothetical protein KGI98_16985 [Euryarchaeota archaeon]|nr:hypothetical protein [Euryarchaeota archaeon]MDE1881837.1 hypothetical protein [Euryarchaeota archaeon]
MTPSRRESGAPRLQQDLEGNHHPVSYGDSWHTPRWILKILFRDGRFFDPCPFDPFGSGGIDKEWPTDRTVFINAPGSDPMPWVQKAHGHQGPVIMLLKNDPTAQWHSYEEFFDVVVIGSRLHFSEKVTYARETYSLWFKPKIPQVSP